MNKQELHSKITNAVLVGPMNELKDRLNQVVDEVYKEIENAKGFSEWLEHGANDSGKKILESAVFAGIVSDAFLKNPACALQVGFAVLMDKPIVLMAMDDVKLPAHLVRVARHIEKVRRDVPDDMQRAHRAIQKTIANLGE